MTSERGRDSNRYDSMRLGLFKADAAISSTFMPEAYRKPSAEALENLLDSQFKTEQLQKLNMAAAAQSFRQQFGDMASSIKLADATTAAPTTRTSLADKIASGGFAVSDTSQVERPNAPAKQGPASQPGKGGSSIG